MLSSYHIQSNKIFFLFIDIQGYFFISWLFLQALLDPLNHTDFIYNVGLLVYMIEFLNIHSSGMLMGEYESRTMKGVHISKKVLFMFYFFFVLGFLAVAKNKYLVIVFLLSLISKFFWTKASPHRPTVAISTLVFLGITFLTLPLASALGNIFYFPPEIRQFKPPNTSGLFFDVPQVLLVWGVLYFLTMGIMQIIMFLRSK